MGIPRPYLFGWGSGAAGQGTKKGALYVEYFAESGGDPPHGPHKFTASGHLFFVTLARRRGRNEHDEDAAGSYKKPTPQQGATKKRTYLATREALQRARALLQQRSRDAQRLGGASTKTQKRPPTFHNISGPLLINLKIQSQ